VDKQNRLSCDGQVALSQTFDEAPHWQLLKEVFSHVFATPKRHHRSKPFFDHVIAFCIADGRVWLRNYQVRNHPSDQ
jgi:ribosome biogenesis protein BRX1